MRSYLRLKFTVNCSVLWGIISITRVDWCRANSAKVQPSTQVRPGQIKFGCSERGGGAGLRGASTCGDKSWCRRRRLLLTLSAQVNTPTQPTVSLVFSLQSVTPSSWPPSSAMAILSVRFLLPFPVPLPLPLCTLHLTVHYITNPPLLNPLPSSYTLRLPSNIHAARKTPLCDHLTGL